jgi:tricorn protease
MRVIFGQFNLLEIIESSAPHGDICPGRFEQAGLHPRLGQRTWGSAVTPVDMVLYSMGAGFDSRVRLCQADTAAGDCGVGVDPNILVENEPALVISRDDPQLPHGNAKILNKLKVNPRVPPSRPPDPVKTPKLPITKCRGWTAQ